jgi:hypothetical protein
MRLHASVSTVLNTDSTRRTRRACASRFRICWKFLRAIALASLSIPLAATSLHAASIPWTGAGSSALWSDPGNWLNAAVPATNDSVEFGPTARTSNTLNYDVSLGSIAFRPDAALMTTTIGGSTPATLTLTGAGIVNNYVPASDAPPANQQIIVGPRGGLTFANNATVSGDSFVEMFAAAGRTQGEAGGTITFTNSASSSTRSGVVVRGADVAGAGAGTLIFEGASSSTGYQHFIGAGTVPGAAGGRLIVRGLARVSDNLFLSATGAGDGPTAEFSDNALIQGGLWVGEQPYPGIVKASARAIFRGSSRLAGAGFVYAGSSIEFRGSSLMAAVNPDPGYAAQVYVDGSLDPDLPGGTLDFYDDASVAGNFGYINNSNQSDGVTAGRSGVTTFHDRSSAGRASISNRGGLAAGGVSIPASTRFLNSSTASESQISADGGYVAGAPGATIEFRDNATAARSSLYATSGRTDADGNFVGLGARIVFSGNADGASASVGMEGNAELDISASTRPGGITLGSLNAPGGRVVMGRTDLTVAGGSSFFGGELTGGPATFTKNGPGFLGFYGTASHAGDIIVNGGTMIFDGRIASATLKMASGTTLRGSGTSTGPVVLQPGVTVAPGFDGVPAVLSLGQLRGSNTSYQFRLGDNGNDRIDIAGDLSTTGTIAILPSGNLSQARYRLFNYTGSLAGTSLTLASVPAGYSLGDFSLDASVAGQISLINNTPSDFAYFNGTTTSPNGTVNGGSGTWDNAATNWTNSAGSIAFRWRSKTAFFAGPAGGTVTVTEPVSARALVFLADGYSIAGLPGASVTLSNPGSTLVSIINLGAPDNSATLNVPINVDAANELELAGNFRFTAPLNAARIRVQLDRTEVTAPNVLTAGSIDAFAALVYSGASGAGNVSIMNRVFDASAIGNTLFTDNASAGSASITNAPGSASAGVLRIPSTTFAKNATAGDATIRNQSVGFTFNAGQLNFRDNSNAGRATIVNEAGVSASSIFGLTVFYNRSSAGQATISNLGATAADGSGGSVEFSDESSAGSARITNFGGSNTLVSVPATVLFSSSASAGQALIINEAGSASPGTTRFFNTSTASGATLQAIGGGASAKPGQISFHDQSSAGTATVSLLAPAVVGGATSAGVATFYDRSSAGNANIRVSGAGGISAGSGATGGNVSFYDDASAGSAVIENLATFIDGPGFSSTYFFGRSTAGNATIYIRTATADDRPEPGQRAYAGFVSFINESSAGTATIISEGVTLGQGTAGGILVAGSASLADSQVFLGGSIAGSAGSQLQLVNRADGARARITMSGNSTLLIETATGGTTLASLNGSGTVTLDSTNTLKLTGNSIAGPSPSDFAGRILGGGASGTVGGRLVVSNPGTVVTLRNSSTYAGGTVIESGAKLVAANLTGSATGTGPVRVESGATLGGSGFIAGPVQVLPGGVVAPGDPVTLTLLSDLTLDGGSTITLAVGPDDASSDRLIIGGSLVHGTSGPVYLNLLDFGAVVGRSYSLISAGQLSGFSASNLVLTGPVAADFRFGATGLSFTVIGVPEPAVLFSSVLVLPLLMAPRRPSRSRRNASRHL